VPSGEALPAFLPSHVTRFSPSIAHKFRRGTRSSMKRRRPRSSSAPSVIRRAILPACRVRAHKAGATDTTDTTASAISAAPCNGVPLHKTVAWKRARSCSPATRSCSRSRLPVLAGASYFRTISCPDPVPRAAAEEIQWRAALFHDGPRHRQRRQPDTSGARQTTRPPPRHLSAAVVACLSPVSRSRGTRAPKHVNAL
jgi:hypothetical protein